MSADPALYFATLYNLTGVGSALALSLLVLRLRVAPFFRTWTIGYAGGVLTAVASAALIWFGPHIGLTVLQGIAAVVPIAFFYRTGRTLAGRPVQGLAWPDALAAMGLALVVAGELRGWPLELYMMPLAVLLASSTAWLGVVLVRSAGGAAWHGVPLVLSGLWLFTYPLFAVSPWFWVGYWVSGTLSLWVGIGMVVFVLDHQARELRLKNAELRQLDQLKHGFLSTVSHELRTPLTSVIGYLELLEDGAGGELSAQQAAYVTDMQDSAHQLAELVDALLDSAQLEAGALKVLSAPLALTPVIESALAPLGGLAEARGVRLVHVREGDLPPVVADARRVRQVLNNIVGNALKYTPAGGRVLVRARLEGGFVRVEVQDTGPGIAPEQQPHLFDAFYRTDESLTREYAGTGLGLAIARRLVTAMDGQIGVMSAPGEGSTFWFTLPVAGERLAFGEANGP